MLSGTRTHWRLNTQAREKIETQFAFCTVFK
jgi:hypothetical protein